MEEAAEEAQRTFELFDTNRDGHLSKLELAAAAEKSAVMAEYRDRIHAMFKKYDKNGDGRMNREELKSLFLGLSADVTAVELDFAFTHADLNHDGLISVEEFICWVTGPPKDPFDRDKQSKMVCQANLSADEPEPEKQRSRHYEYYDKYEMPKPKPNKFDEPKDIGRRASNTTQMQNGRRASNGSQVQNARRGSANVSAKAAKRSSVKEAKNALEVSVSAQHPKEIEAASLSSGIDDLMHKGLDERHEHLARASASHAEEDESDWSTVFSTFAAFSRSSDVRGSEMDGSQFAKLCSECHLLDDNFRNVDIDSMYLEALPRDHTRIDFKHFKDLCRNIARKKHCKVLDVQSLLSNSSIPELHATKKPAPVLHSDEKSLDAQVEKETCKDTKTV